MLIGIDFLIAHKCIINFDNNTAYSKGGPSKMVFVLIENVYRISIAETVKYHQIWLLIYLARLKGFAAWSFLSVWLHHEVSKVFRWGRTKCNNCKRWSNTNSCTVSVTVRVLLVLTSLSKFTAATVGSANELRARQRLE